MALIAADEIYNRVGVHVDPDLLWAQMVHETGWFSSPLSKYHNYGGMKTFDEDTGLPAPEGETGWYKRYNSDEEFARDWARTLAYSAKGLPDNPDPATWAHSLKQNGYYEDTEENYRDGLLGILGKSPIEYAFSTPTDAYGSHHVLDEEIDYNKESSKRNQATITDRFLNQFLDAGAMSGIRTLATNISNLESLRDMPLLNNYTPSEEDIKYVQDALPNNITAQSYVLNNATSSRALRELTQDKVEDLKRQERVDNSDITLASAASVAGAVLDPTLLLAIVPGLGPANVTSKALNLYNKMTKLQKAASATYAYFDKYRLLQYGAGRAEIMAGQLASKYPTTLKYGKAVVAGAFASGTDRFLAERWGGWEPDYAPSMIMGGVAGGILRKAGDMVSTAYQDRLNRNSYYREAEAVEDEVGDVVGDAVEQVSPTPSPSATQPQTRTQTQSPNVQRLVANDSAEPDTKGLEALEAHANKTAVDAVAPEPEAQRSKAIVTAPDDTKTPHDLAEPMAMNAAKAQLNLPVFQDFAARVRQYAAKKNDTSMVERGSLAEEMMNAGKLAIMSKKSAQNIARKFGIKIDKHAQAMTIPTPDGGISIIFSSKKLTKEKLDGLVAHEVGIHLGLRRMLGDEEYDNLLRSIKRRITPPKRKQGWATGEGGKKPKLSKARQAWLEAGKAADGDPEEALAYWAEHNFKPDKGLIHGLLKEKIPELFGKDSTDIEINDLIARSLRLQATNRAPIMTLDDGSHVAYGIHYSKDNAFNTFFSEVDDSGRFSKMMQSGLIKKKIPKWLKAPFGLLGISGRTFEHGWFWGNNFGIMANSNGREMRRFGLFNTVDPRQRGIAEKIRNTVLSTEEIKGNTFNRFMIKYNKFIDLRTDYLHKTLPFYKRYSNTAIRMVDEQIVRCYDAMYGTSRLDVSSFDPEIQAMCRQLKDLRDDIVKMGKKNGTELGGNTNIETGIIDADWKPDDEGFYRIINQDKWTEFMMGFKDAKEAISFLKQYAYRALNRKVMHKRYDDMIAKEKADFQAKLKENPPAEGQPIPEFQPSMSYEQFEKNAINKWASQILEHKNSSMEWSAKVESARGDSSKFDPRSDRLAQFQRRLPMDTSIEMRMKNGNTFCFDDDLRNYDLDMFLPQILNKSAGDIAIHAMYGDRLPDIVNAVRKENELLRVTEGERVAKREWDAFVDSLEQILGVRLYSLDEEKVGTELSRLFRTAVYSRVGGDMTFAQLGEMGGMMAYGGFKTLLSVCPSLENMIRKARLGEQTAEAITRAESLLRAEDINTKCWDITSSTESRWARRLMGVKGVDNPNYRTLGVAGDAVSSMVKRAGMLTSTLNRMTALTDSMIAGMRRATIEDSIEWARGKKFNFLRNPFSDKKLQAAGLTQSDAAKIKRGIKRYLLDGEGDVESWMDEDPTTFYQWKTLIDRQSRRGIQQMTVGGSNLFKTQHPIIMQFKDFALRAINEQTLRALTSKEADDVMAAMLSMGTNCATYVALTEARAYAMYPDNKYKRQQFLNKQLTMERLVGAAITRGALTGSLLSFGMDGYEAFTGNPMFRTTVNNTFNQRRRGDPANMDASSARRDMVNKFGQVMNQVPAFGTVVQDAMAVGGSVALASGKGHADDWDAIIRALPLGTWTAMTYLSHYAKKGLDLREER